MALPPFTQLDFEQVITGSYDETNRRIRVETEIATVDVGGNQEILITDDIDAIKIGNGSHQYLAINSDGSINVNIEASGSNGTTISYFNNITSVSNGISTTLLTYTIPTLKTGYLERIELSGSNIAIYDFFISGVLNGRQRTYFGGELNGMFNFLDPINKGISLIAGTNIQIIVTHYRPYLGDFEARLQLVLI